MALSLYNTRTRQKELFEPLTPGVVRIYTCGLTVYAPMHIGHARTYCFWDLLRRYLEYRGLHVLSAINYTDIDDRIMAKAGPEHGVLDVAEQNIAAFRRDCRLLGIGDYAVYTRATDFVDAQIDMVRALVERGHAYVVDGEVFYDVSSFPRYGALSGRSVDEQLTGASGRVGEDVSRKRHPADFTLWKPSAEGQPSWETGEPQWPTGRPGWHIECSAMSSAVLGAHFDIHGGAIDNLFPHHENEVAQSEPVCGEPWVRYWLHPEHLDLRGEKMSKSLGNVIGVPDLCERHRPDEVRWFFASQHYRTRLGFSEDLITSATEGYRRVDKLLRLLGERLLATDPAERAIHGASVYASLRPEAERIPRMRHRYTHGTFGAITRDFMTRFIEAMDDDIHTPRATAALFEWVNQLYAAGVEKHEHAPSLLAVYQALARHLWVLGCEHPNAELYPELAVECVSASDGAAAAGPYRAAIDRMVGMRSEARTQKDFARADALRDLLSAAGIEVEDTPEGPRWSLRG